MDIGTASQLRPTSASSLPLHQQPLQGPSTNPAMEEQPGSPLEGPSAEWWRRQAGLRPLACVPQACTQRRAVRAARCVRRAATPRPRDPPHAHCARQESTRVPAQRLAARCVRRAATPQRRDRLHARCARVRLALTPLWSAQHRILASRSPLGTIRPRRLPYLHPSQVIGTESRPRPTSATWRLLFSGARYTYRLTAASHGPQIQMQGIAIGDESLPHPTSASWPPRSIRILVVSIYPLTRARGGPLSLERGRVIGQALPPRPISRGSRL